MGKRRGRRKGSHNRGYFHYKSRGWFAMDDGKKVALCYEDGERIRDLDEDQEVVKDAYYRWRKQKKQRLARQQPDAIDPVSVRETVHAYLKYAKLHAAPKTYKERAASLFDLTTGLPPRYRTGRSRKEDRDRDRIHAGFGDLPASELTPLQIDDWIAAHPNWTKGGWRSHVQAVKRMLNYCVERQLLKESPLKGYQIPKPNPRRVYITPKQEALLVEHANPALAQAIRICIRTGARPGAEYAHLEARHVRDHGERMEWIIPENESKSDRLRIIRVTEPYVINCTREAIAAHRSGKLFRALHGSPWSTQSLKERFRALREKVEKVEGIPLGTDREYRGHRGKGISNIEQGISNDESVGAESVLTTNTWSQLILFAT